MKKILSGIVALFCISGVYAQVKMPAASPTQFIKQEFGLGSIELTYSRPGLKGRNMIGNIEPWVPYGVQVPMLPRDPFHR